MEDLQQDNETRNGGWFGDSCTDQNTGCRVKDAEILLRVTGWTGWTG